MSFLTGGSKSSSQSKNVSYPWLKDQYSGQVQTGTGANSLLSSLLGVDGGNGAAGQAGLDSYKNSAGYENAIASGSKAITGNNASRGLLTSGATGKALTQFGQDTGQKYYNDYLSQLLGLSGQGLQAGGLIGNAGQTSNSKSSQKEGLGGFIGSALSAAPMLAASDPRLKRDIKEIDRLPNGLGIYEYRYKWDKPGTVRKGYMADEVKEIAPHALGPKQGDYMTVRYDLLPPL